MKTSAQRKNLSAYEAGIVDGNECRRRGRKPSIFLRVEFDDAYSSGFMAGFRQGPNGKKEPQRKKKTPPALSLAGKKSEASDA